MPVEILDDGRKRLVPPLSGDDVRALEAGDAVVVRGTVYGARDAAHRRMEELLDRGEGLPFEPLAQSSTTWGPPRSAPAT